MHKRYVIKFTIDLGKNKKNQDLKIIFSDDKKNVSLVLGDINFKTPVKKIENNIFSFTKDVKIGCENEISLKLLSKFLPNEILRTYSFKSEEDYPEFPKSKFRVLKHNGDRIETGALKFNDDYAGVFFRGDASLFNANLLDELLNTICLFSEGDNESKIRKLESISKDVIMVASLKGLIDTFRSCHE